MYDWNQIFECDPEIGKVIRKVNLGKYKAGTIAGNKNYKGYIIIEHKNKAHRAHRIIWNMFRGPIPDNMEIDHINGIRDDNRLVNLRLATRSQNASNSKRSIRNTSGYIGVRLNQTGKKWISEIKINNKKKRLGLFNTKEEAYDARLKAESIYHGEFAQSFCRK